MEESDMPKRIKHRVTINEKEYWITGKTEQEVLENYKRRLIDCGCIALKPEPVKQLTFYEYAESFMSHSKRNGQVRHTTLAGYESSLKNHLYPFFGDMLLSQIDVQRIEEFIGTKKQYAKKTIHEMILVLTFILDGAIEDKHMSAPNPAKSKRARNYVSAKKSETRDAYTEEQLHDIIAHIPDMQQVRDRRLLALLCFMPVRREDVLGIKIKDISVEGMCLTIERSVTFALHAFTDPVTGISYHAGQPVIGDPKTEAGFRNIPILPQLWDMLELTEEELQDGERFLLHHRLNPYEPYTGQTMKNAWSRIKSTINVYGKTPHYFRHTFATLGQRAGIPEKTMQTLGGWKDVRTLKKIYTHTQSKDIHAAGIQMQAMYG